MPYPILLYRCLGVASGSGKATHAPGAFFSRPTTRAMLLVAIPRRRRRKQTTTQARGDSLGTLRRLPLLLLLLWMLLLRTFPAVALFRIAGPRKAVSLIPLLGCRFSVRKTLKPSQMSLWAKRSSSSTTTIVHPPASSSSATEQRHNTTNPTSPSIDPPPSSATARNIPCPEGLSYLPFQEVAVREHLVPASTEASRRKDGRRGLVLGDEMGLGKTISVAGALNVLLAEHYGTGEEDEEEAAGKRRQFRAVVVAPKSVLPHWHDELTRWIVLPPKATTNTTAAVTANSTEETTRNYGPKIGTITAKKGIAPDQRDCDVYLVNYEIVGKYLDDLTDLFQEASQLENETKASTPPPPVLDVLVCDECHYLKSVDSQRTQSVLGHHLYPQSQPGLAGIAQTLWLVTGSPVLNNPLDMFPLLQALLVNNGDTTTQQNPTLAAFPELTALGTFRDRYCHKRVTPWGIVYKGGKNLRELSDRLVRPLAFCDQDEDDNDAEPKDDDDDETATIMATTPLLLRRTKTEVLTDLPAKRHQLFVLKDGGRTARHEYEVLEGVLRDTHDSYANAQSKGHTTTGLETHLRGLRVPELKELARGKGLLVGGTKAQLIERLLLAAHGDHDGETSNRPIGGGGHEISPSHMGELKEEAIVGASANTPTPEIHSNAISVLQSAPREHRKDVLRDLLRGPRGILKNGQTNPDGNGQMLLGALGKAKHQSALRKVPYVLELLEVALLSHKVVVFCHHRDVQTAIYQRFRDRAVHLHGDTPQDERPELVRAFQTDSSVRLFVGSLKASGLGLTLTAASHVVVVELDWSPSIVQQAEDRCHRVGQTEPVLVQYVVFEGTIDEHLSHKLVEKQRTVAFALGDPAGSPEAAASWVLDFGKHAGKTLAEVAAEDPGYLEWLVDEGIPIERRKRQIDPQDVSQASEDDGDDSTLNGTDHPDNEDALTKGLIELGFLDNDGNKPRNLETDSDQEEKLPLPSSIDSGQAGDHVLTFGKHKGKALREIPRPYLVWMSMAGASRRDAGLTKALRAYLRKSS